MVAPSAGGSRLPWQRTPTTNPFLTNSKKIRRSKRATNTHKHGPGSYLSDGTRGDSQSHAERDPLRSKDRGLFTYNIDIVGQGSYQFCAIHTADNTDGKVTGGG